MRASEFCVYCGTKMNRIENDDLCRTVEHMIPQVSVAIKRNNGEGDFHVCRKCNGEKSKIDDILGITCRMVGGHPTGSLEAIKKFKQRLEKNDRRFNTAFNSHRLTSLGHCISLPLNRKQLFQYGEWLAKGVFFINTGKLLSNQYLLWVEIISHAEVLAIKECYKRKIGSEAFDDLSKNNNFPNINGESFILNNGDSKEIMVCFNRTLIFHMKLLENNRINQTLCNQAWRKLHVR